MALELTNMASQEGAIRKAAESRITSAYPAGLSSDELQKLVDAFLENKLGTLEKRELAYAAPVYFPSDLLSSSGHREDLRNRRFFTEVLSRQVSALETNIEQSKLLYNDLLKNAQQTWLGIAGSVFGEFGARVTWGLSQGLGFLQTGSAPAYLDPTYQHFQDPRTGRKFLQRERLDFDNAPFGTLPIQHIEYCDVKDIAVDLTGTIGYESHVEHSPATHLLPGHSPFRARFFLGKAPEGLPLFGSIPFIRVQVKLSAVTMINRISFEAAADGFFSPVVFEYWADNDWHQWNPVITDGTGLVGNCFIMSRAITDQIRITFTSFATGEANIVTRNDTEAVQLNELLAESSWKARFSENTAEFNGLVIDWLIKDLRFSYMTTLARGFCMSNPLTFTGHLKKLLSAVQASDVRVSEEHPEFPFAAFALRTGSLEGYLLVKGVTESGLPAIDELVPMPNAFRRGAARECEWLPLIGMVGKLRLFPLLNINESKLQANGTETDHTDILPLVWSTVRGELTIGTDYHVSVDGGTTWLTAWPSSDFYGTVSYAGTAAIKILSRSENEDFAVSYYKALNQWLTSGRNFKLHGNRVFASDELKAQRLSYEIRHAVIARQSSQFQSDSPVTLGVSFFGEKHVN